MNLRKYRAADFGEISKWIPSSRFLLQWAGPGFDYPLTLEQFTARHSDNPQINAFTLEDNGTPLGYGEVVELPDQQGRLCRVIVSETTRGKGLGKYLTGELVNTAFTRLALTKLSLNVFDFNQSAIKCYQNIGFKEVKKNKRRTRI